MNGSAILFLLCCTGFTAGTTVCPGGWFGSRCQYKCHCLNNGPCEEKNGTCQSGCESGWFGLACQYMDLAATNSSGNSDTYERILTDNNDTTCYNGTSPSAVNLTLDTDYPFTWLRVHVQDPDLLYNLRVQFSDHSGAVTWDCQNQRNVVVSERTLDIHCHLNVTIRQVILLGQGVNALCSIYISGGRNIALHENTQQSSTYNDISTNSSYPANLAVDGNTNGTFNARTCTHTGDNDPLPLWNLTFQQPRLVTRYVLYNRIDNSCNWCARLERFTLTSFGENISVVFNYTDSQSTAQSMYTVIQEPWLEPVSYLEIYLNRPQSFLTLCEVEVYGDSICETGKYGRDCEHTCNCAQNEACFVNSGGCPSGCAAGFWGDRCGTECPPKRYGVNCMLTCSDECVDQLCDTRTGHCLNCQPRKFGDFCEKSCPRDTYDVNCRSNCNVHCAEAGTQPICDAVNGVCLHGCATGYTESYCNMTCEAGKYGLGCKYCCSHQCLLPENEDVKSPCSHIDGNCLLGCVSGYEGLTCSHLKSDDSELTRGIGIGVGATVGLVMIVAAVVGLIVLSRRKMKSQTLGEAIPSPEKTELRSLCLNQGNAVDLPRETSSATSTGEVLASSNRESL